MTPSTIPTTVIYIITTVALLLTSLYYYIISQPIKRSITTSDTILGYGSRGTVVVEGVVDGRKVAVKKMPEHVANKKAFERCIHYYCYVFSYLAEKYRCY